MGIKCFTLGVLTSCTYSPTELSWQVLIKGYLPRLLFVHQLALDLEGLAEMNEVWLCKDL